MDGLGLSYEHSLLLSLSTFLCTGVHSARYANAFPRWKSAGSGYHHSDS